jgi:hypothetical protein
VKSPHRFECLEYQVPLQGYLQSCLPGFENRSAIGRRMSVHELVAMLVLFRAALARYRVAVSRAVRVLSRNERSKRM